MSDGLYTPVNPNAQECVKNVLKYLSDISGDMVITGQHTQTMEQEELHKLNNLIWIWNSPSPECYPGDDVVDIISRDMYPLKHEHTSQGEKYHELLRITERSKIALIGEIGTLPDVDSRQICARCL